MRHAAVRLLGHRLGLKPVIIVFGIAGLAAVVVAAAGQAVGPVLSGGTSGSTAITVEQAITLDTDLAVGANPVVSGADDWTSTRNDEGTAFSVALEVNQGQRATVSVLLENFSGADASAVLELTIPAGIDVELSEISDGITDNTLVVSEAQLTRETWLVVVKSAAGSGNNDGLVITVEPKDDIRPGFHTITGRLVQTGG